MDGVAADYIPIYALPILLFVASVPFLIAQFATIGALELSRKRKYSRGPRGFLVPLAFHSLLLLGGYFFLPVESALYLFAFFPWSSVALGFVVTAVLLCSTTWEAPPGNIGRNRTSR